MGVEPLAAIEGLVTGALTLHDLHDEGGTAAIICEINYEEPVPELKEKVEELYKGLIADAESPLGQLVNQEECDIEIEIFEPEKPPAPERATEEDALQLRVKRQQKKRQQKHI